MAEAGDCRDEVIDVNPYHRDTPGRNERAPGVTLVPATC
jgi:hypothetical protein